MKYTIRIPEALHVRIREDLHRPHPVAYERVGFLFARSNAAGTLFLGYDYEPVAEDGYIPDDSVGAKIGSSAIRAALQRALTSGDSVFHVHMHAGTGRAYMGRVDAESLQQLLPSFYSANPEANHGAIIFSEDEVTAWVWRQSEQKFVTAESVSIVGFPSRAFRSEVKQ